jgi:periplasmic protein TonB
VSVLLTIDPGGRVVSCGIQQSSGQSVLDMYTCNILRRRARFTPATDALGNPVIGTVKAQVDWDEVFRRFR